MHVVWQGETGGHVAFVNKVEVATSGFVYVVDRERKIIRFDGMLASGQLFIAKSGIANLHAGQYTMLPQVIDANNLVYFLNEFDLLVEPVPDFFLTPY